MECLGFLFIPADIKDVELVEVQENVEHEGDSENIVDEMDITEDDRDFLDVVELVLQFGGGSTTLPFALLLRGVWCV